MLVRMGNGKGAVVSQPLWKYVTNLGDASPIEYGGLFLYEDETGVYPPELEKLEEPRAEDARRKRWTVRRVTLDKLQIVRREDTLYLVPAAWDATWPHPLPDYVEWFASDLSSVAACMGTTRDELEQAFCSDDSASRAWAYQCVYDYHGWDNGDAYPLTLTRKEVAARYEKELTCAK